MQVTILPTKRSLNDIMKRMEIHIAWNKDVSGNRVLCLGEPAKIFAVFAVVKIRRSGIIQFEMKPVYNAFIKAERRFVAYSANFFVSIDAKLLIVFN